MIVIRKFGKIYRKESDKIVEVVSDLIPYLNDTIEFGDGLIFEDFMFHILSYSDKYSEVFSSQLGHYNLKDWISDFLNEQKDDSGTEIIEYLEVAHSDIEIDAYGTQNSYKITEIDVYNSFHGIGEWEEKETGKVMGGVAIEFTSLYTLRKLPLKLNKKVRITDIQTYDEICVMEKLFTVYDVISAILFEISWSGNPVQRDAQCKIILDRSEEIQKEIDNGTLRTKPMDELFDELRKKFDDMHKDDDEKKKDS